MWRADDPPCDKHFQNPGHKFNEHAKFMIIEKINNASLRKQQRRSHLEHTEGFRILKLNILSKRSEHILKGYLYYKTILCHKVALDVQLMNFFI